MWPWAIVAVLVVNAAVILSGVWRPEIPDLGTGSQAEVGGAVLAPPSQPRPAETAPGRQALTTTPPAASPRPSAPPATPAQVAARGETVGAEQAALPDPATALRSADQSLAAAPVPSSDAGSTAAMVQPDLSAAATISDLAASPEPVPAADRPEASPQIAKTPTVPAATPVETAPTVAAAPRPAKKPAAILALASPTPQPGSPNVSDTGSAAATGPDLALAVAEPELPVTEAPPDPDPYADVPLLWQLPSSIRSKLPAVSLTVHVYSPEPSERFVIVGRKKRQEGDTLASGVKIEAILPDGVVLDYLGRTFRLSN
jgi:general secretion pathway protein B